ncbi:3-oxoacyl-ACP reductase FabG [Nocardia carnea]|uniref:3-oxoacyl-ACP reductase FabG n=1 Tax=Nocardia carnea TaxID=37328 RepID=UPI002456A31C|nr:3-oxoacyl-ACP reductase FabG [Nocardia carnea]
MGNLTYDFTGKTVLVSGAGRGIGLSVATFFADAGADVFALDADKEALDTAQAPVTVRRVQLDVTDSTAVDAVVNDVVEATGRIDILVNNAGILRDRMVWKLTDDEWEAVLAVHAGGTFRLTRAAIPHMRAQNVGRIINVTSFTGLRGNAGQANYSAAKAGIIGFTKTVAKEVGRFGITVNAISPAADTRMTAGIPDELREAMIAAIPLQRVASPEEIPPSVGFLASDEAAYITGAILTVDGGGAI